MSSHAEATGFQRVSVSGELWAQIIYRVKESDDYFLRQLVEQAAVDAKIEWPEALAGDTE